MNEKRWQGSSSKAQRKVVVRASIILPPDLYETLEQIAQQKKVSLVWVARDASERHVVERSSEGFRSRSAKG